MSQSIEDLKYIILVYRSQIWILNACIYIDYSTKEVFLSNEFKIKIEHMV